MIRAPKHILAISFDKASIGKRFKASKKRYTWKLEIEDVSHTVEMYVSELSGKRKMMLDGEMKYSGKAATGIFFQFPFKVGSHSLCVVQQDSEWDLKIDNVSFSRLQIVQRQKVTSQWPDDTEDDHWDSGTYQIEGPPSPHTRWNGTMDTTAEYPMSSGPRSRDSWAKPSLPDSESWELRSHPRPPPAVHSPAHSPKSLHQWDYDDAANQFRSIPQRRSGQREWEQWEEGGREKERESVSIPARREKEDRAKPKPQQPIDLLDFDAVPAATTTRSVIPPQVSSSTVSKPVDDLSFLTSAPATQPGPVMPSSPSASHNPFLAPQPAPGPHLPIGAPGPITNPMAAALFMQSYMTGLMMMQQQQRSQPKYY